MSTQVQVKYGVLFIESCPFGYLISLIKIKIRFFQALAVSVLFNGCTTGNSTKGLEKKQDRNYTRMLYVVLNKSVKQHPIQQWLCCHLRPISQTLQFVRKRHCWRSKNEDSADVYLYTHINTYKRIHTHTHTYIYICVCVCVCVRQEKSLVSTFFF